jgi:hypothetical protein
MSAVQLGRAPAIARAVRLVPAGNQLQLIRRDATPVPDRSQPGIFGVTRERLPVAIARYSLSVMAIVQS